MKTLYRNLVSKPFGGLLGDRSGGLGVAAAFLIPVITGAAMMGIDSQRINTLRAALGAATDTATLNVTTAWYSISDPEAEGNRFFHANFQEGTYGATPVQNANGTGPMTISHQMVNGTLEVTGHAAVEVPLIFGSMVGMDVYRIEHTAVAERGSQKKIEVFFAVDASPDGCTLVLPAAQAAGIASADGTAAGSSSSTDTESSSGAAGSSSSTSEISGDGSSSSASDKIDAADFTESKVADNKAEVAAILGATSTGSDDSPAQIVPDPNCRTMESIKTVLTNFINQVYVSDSNEDVAMGLIEFNHKAVFKNGLVPTPIADGEAEDPTYWQDLSDAMPLNEVQGLTHTKSEILAAVQAIEPDAIDGMGWSRGTIGAWGGGLGLDPAYHASYGGEEPAPLGSPDVEKYLVLIENSPSYGAAYSENAFGDVSDQYLYIYRTDEDELEGFCEIAKRPASQGGAGIKIVTAMVGLEPGTWHDIYSENISEEERFGDQWAKRVRKDCATTPQHFFDVPAATLNDSSNIVGPLKQAMDRLHESIAGVRLKY